MLVNRSIGVSILLSIVTCGIYMFVWMACLSNELSRYNEENVEGGLEIFLIIITCGVYGIYWGYKMGKRIVTAQMRAGARVSDNSGIYIALSVFAYHLVSIGLMQNQVNEIA